MPVAVVDRNIGEQKVVFTLEGCIVRFYQKKDPKGFIQQIYDVDVKTF